MLLLVKCLPWTFGEGPEVYLFAIKYHRKESCAEDLCEPWLFLMLEDLQILAEFLKSYRWKY